MTPSTTTPYATAGSHVACGSDAPGGGRDLPPPCGLGWWERLSPVLRGLLAVAWLLVTALDALVTALVGIAPLAPRLRRIGQVIASEYRTGRAGAVDGEVLDDDVIDDDRGAV